MSRVKLGDVAFERKETLKNNTGLPTVGLEHIIPEEIELTNWDEGADNTFTKVFHVGDVLFGRRRAYLKKAAVAPIDGICSGDITVISANEDKISPRLLPFIIQNDSFFDFAVEKSAGSLSPRVKWQHAKEYEFELPDMDKQEELSGLLWSMNATKMAYKKLLQKTDELVKSQFIEMFGELEKNSRGLEIATIGSFAEVKGGKRLPKGTGYADMQTDHPYIRVVDMIDHTVNMADLQYIDEEVHSKISRYIIRKNDVYISIAGTIGLVGMIPDCLDGANLTENAAKIVLKENAPVLPEYLTWYLSLPAGAKQIEDKTMHTTQPKLALFRIEEIKVLVPSYYDQKLFVEFVEQSDKSKFELEQAIAELTTTYKRIIADNLG